MAFAENEAMQKKWKAFCRKIDTKTDDFNAVLKTIKAFLIEPFMAAVENKEFEENGLPLMTGGEDRRNRYD